MSYRSALEYAVRWSDGLSWKVDDVSFARVTRALDDTRATIEDVGPILDRWHALTAQDTEIQVDALCHDEADRAVFTAAVARALDDARGASDEGADVTVDRLAALHELFMTDVTR